MEIKNQLTNLNPVNYKYLPKRAKAGKNVYKSKIEQVGNFPKNITFLPVEIIFEILSYLSYSDLNSLKKVSTFFERVTCDPTVWKNYEVKNNDINTGDVIKELKRMPFLKKLTIDDRSDSDVILRQLSLTNKNLEELYISNCTGSTSRLYLRPVYLIRILERCNRLHTIFIIGSRFRGLKFYKLLGSLGLQLKNARTPATPSQFRTFATFAKHISDKDRQMLFDLCINMRARSSMHYLLVNRKTGPHTVLINYLFNDFLAIQVQQTAANSKEQNLIAKISQT